MPDGPTEGYLLTSFVVIPNACPFEPVGVQEKSSPFMEGDRGDERRVEKVPTYVASIVKKLCGVIPNPSIWVPFEGGPLAIKEGNLVFLLTFGGFNNFDLMIGPFEISFGLPPCL